MTAFNRTRLGRKLWTLGFGERAWVQRTGDFRTKERYGLIQRPNYAYGMLRAADLAKFFGHQRATVIEFGVAGGNGLRNMTALAQSITELTKIEFDIVGFDAGDGLPAIDGYKDHPELWNPGDFANPDKAALLADVSGKAEIVWGDIRDTLPTYNFKSPIGFVSIDVDIYSATKSAFQCLTRQPDKYLPAVSMYFDDVSFFFANRWCGELLAISEFNEAEQLRKIDNDRSLISRPFQDSWHCQMYVCHILDHTARQRPIDRERLDIDRHNEFMRERFLI